jgi:hypothetical protein
LKRKITRITTTVVNVPFKFRQVTKGLCNPDLPQDASVSTRLDNFAITASSRCGRKRR